MSLRSIGSLASALKGPKISRRRLSRYSWLPDVLRVEGSITLRIIGPVLTVTIFASAVAYAHRQGQNVTLTNSVTPLLAVVVGLILVFRNSTSYDRFYEGRKDFGAMTSNIRNLSRLIWVSVAAPPEGMPTGIRGSGKQAPKLLSQSQLYNKKTDALKLCIAFAYAVKNRLRAEEDLNHEDFRGVLPDWFARFDEIGFDTSVSPPVGNYSSMVVQDDRLNINGKPNGGRRKHKHGHGIHFNPSSVTLSERGPHTPLLGDSHRTIEFHPYSAKLSMPLPLIIAHELSRIIFKFRRDGYLETLGPAGTNTMNALLNGMVDQLTNMERVANTPIPVSYSIHLKQCVTLYLFALPFTLVRDLDWRMIPVVTVVAFTLMGIEGIANEIEMPFGKEKSDLPLDQFCDDLKEEVEYMMERLPEGGEGMAGYDDGEGDD